MTTSFGAALARTTAILRKELLDTLRDRRTGTVTLLSAILAGPIFLLLIFNLMASQAEHAREMTLPVMGAEYAPAVVAFLQRQQVSVTKAPADYDAQIRRGDLDVVLVIDTSFAKDVEQGKPGTVQLVFDR
jgi:sodium transport system permease protein